MLNLKDKELFDTKISYSTELEKRLLAKANIPLDYTGKIFIVYFNSPRLYYNVKRLYTKATVIIVEDISLKNLYNIPETDIIYTDVTKEFFPNMLINDAKFIINPPYVGNLHLKILNFIVTKFHDRADIVSLQPTRWLQDPNAKEKLTSDFNKFKVTLADQITDLEIIPAAESQKYFDIVNGADLGIYTFDRSIDTKYDLDNLISPLIKKIKSKLINHPVFEKDKKDGWRARIPVILSGGKGGGNGNRKKWHGLGFLGPFYNGKLNDKYWYEYYQKNQHTKFTETISNSIAFGEDKIAAENFCNSLVTTVGYYITYNLIPDVNVKPNTIMWLDDYSHSWDNKSLCKYFDITGFISDTEAVPNSEWEEILNWSKTINIWKRGD